MMKIGIVLARPPGYSETFFNSKIKGLQENGISVVLLVQEAEATFSNCKVVKQAKVYKFLPMQIVQSILVLVRLLPNLNQVVAFCHLEKKAGTSFPILFKKLMLNAHILKQTQLDWLHFGFATLTLGKENCAASIGAKMGVSFRGYDIHTYPKKYPDCYKALWTKVNKVHSISSYLIKEAQSIGMPTSINNVCIPPAVQLELLPQQQKRNSNSLEFVTVARLHWIKGLDISIKALGELDKMGYSFVYHIIGAGTTKQLERYQYLAMLNGIGDKVVFHGKKSHKETLELVNGATFYLQPSLNEGFCNAVLEAQALGKICIANNVGALPENIENTKTGYLVDSKTPQAWVEKIVAVLSSSEAELSEVKEAAIKRVKNNFLQDQQNEAFYNFYTTEEV